MVLPTSEAIAVGGFILTIIGVTCAFLYNMYKVLGSLPQQIVALTKQLDRLQAQIDELQVRSMTGVKDGCKPYLHLHGADGIIPYGA